LHVSLQLFRHFFKQVFQKQPEVVSLLFFRTFKNRYLYPDNRGAEIVILTARIILYKPKFNCMKQQLLKGARILTAEEAAGVDLGALAQLQGTWKSAPVNPKLIANGWNVISVPGVTGGFVYEVIPYTETLTFTPVVVADNRGPVARGSQVVQHITGLIYEQSIISACPGGAQCVKRGFPAGSQIHAETGFFLNVSNPNGGYDIARLGNVPHGNSLLALGHSAVKKNSGGNFIPVASPLPSNLDGSKVNELGFGYMEPITDNQHFPGIFNQGDPNSFLKSTLAGQTITSLTTLQMSTNNKDATGGILSLPFIQTNITTTSMAATFWIETLKGNPALQLQYTQTINLVFPPTGTAVPVVWPHITVNTLTKVA
jgi:hypothetical protein